MQEVTLVEAIAQNRAVEEAKTKYASQLNDQYAEAVKHIDSFVREAAATTRKTVVDIFSTIAAKIRNREVITNTNLSTLRATISNFNGLDFWDDSEVSKKLEEVNKLLKSGASFKDDAKAIKLLDASVQEVLTTVRQVSDVDSTGNYFREINLDL
jgi:hypothetical protein